MDPIKDLFIVGGGINGAGIARDAAGRGLSVTLAEKDDLASHTSSASSKLIHGGLRYLENYEFRLVRESLKEREVLLESAPHLIEPIRFILPHHKAMRPAWMLRLGLFLYDHIGGRKLLPATVTHNLKTQKSGEPLKDHFSKGFEYSDCFADDARLVLLAAKDAAEKGATILTRHKVTSARRSKGIWDITVQGPDGKSETHRARAFVNAAGAWVDHLEGVSSPAPKSAKQIRMVKGSHIVVPKLYEGAHAYTFQNDDNRVVFAIPYQRDYTLVGTTDVPFNSDANNVKISEDERQYLCDIVSKYFTAKIGLKDIAWAYSGVRPLVEDGAENASKASRDYVLELDVQENAPMLSVYGGKITTFRRLSEEALTALKPHLAFSAGDWTANAKLPGGEMGYQAFAAFQASMLTKYGFMNAETVTRMSKAYGTRLDTLLDGITHTADLGRHSGAGLYEIELRYMKEHEWAQTADDALWRRSKLGLFMNKAQHSAVDKWFAAA